MAPKVSFKGTVPGWIRSILGPTTLHFQHEFFLWISLSILTISSLEALYRNSFGLQGDIIYTLLASLWLSRHIILRYIYTTDASTTRSPTLMGLIAHWLTSVAVAGQYFDRSDAQVVAKTVGIAHVEDVMNPTSAFVLPSLTYTMHYVRVLLLDPVLRFLRHPQFLKLPLEFIASFHEMFSHPTIQRIAHYGPSLQLVVASGVFSFCIFYLQVESAPQEMSIFAISMQPTVLSDGTYAPGLVGEIQPEGAYEPLLPPSWQRVFFFMISGSTMLSILFYGRISFPIPDLVTGTNVLKAVRNEARGAPGKSHKSRVQKEQQDGTWGELYKSISGENRFRLACKVTLLRVIDAIICCAILPRTVYVCRATGHCPSTPTLAELSRILYPQGVSGVYRDNSGYKSMFQSINPDRGSALITISSIVVITSVLLLAQLVTLNKSYLAIMGHLAGEWKLVDNVGSGIVSQWDPRRRYKKGDMIVHSYPGFRQSVYMATTNSPEGRPFDLFLRATHDLFRHEVGHQSTSRIITTVVKIHLIFMGVIIMTILYYVMVGYSARSLVTSLFANMVACYGVLQAGLIEYDELERVAAELNAS